MFTTETALESLKKFDIDETTLESWETQLGLSVPVDDEGQKQYSPHHINLFKNIKKHIALGRSIEEIRDIISLPPVTSSKAQPETSASESIPTIPAMPKSYASLPARPNLGASSKNNDAGLLELVNKLVSEKDQLHKKLIETEKLNSHLYNANSMFHRKVKELTNQIGGLKAFINQVQDKLRDNNNLKLLDDKSRLQKQLLDAEKNVQTREQEVEDKHREILDLQEKLISAENRFQDLIHHFDPKKFCGNWVENGRLTEILYDNFGINIETDRSRVFKIADPPERIYGLSANITTYYEYESNALWKRCENLSVAYINENYLQGEILAEYILDGVPVAKAIYKVSYVRKPD